ncbi:hypothetical protein AFLA_010988 [Aspergillus flavus NRRL3357]|nr:hypothetical protein AFLA_010988 [Aspergillus flavus NRRL3357]
MYHCELPRADESFFQSSQRLGCPFKVTGKFQRDVFGKFFRDYGVSIAMQFVTLHMKLSSRFYVDDRVMTLNRLSCHQVVARLLHRMTCSRCGHRSPITSLTLWSWELAQRLNDQCTGMITRVSGWNV